MEDEKKVRGDILISFLKYIKKKWGQDGIKECSDYVGFDPNSIRSGQWYEIHLLIKCYNWLVETKGKNNVKQGGKFVIMNLGLLGYVVRFLKIETLIAKILKEWNEAFNYGRISSKLGSKKVILKAVDFAISDNTCLNITGVFEGVLKLTKNKGTVVETQCQLKGASHCEFLIEWE
ncbi:MAG: hypothetical protein KAR56_03290 [Thermoplasmata archaeon]|nr:hypothetical protein [Thermoplasmata archaeon]